ncbi:MAG: DNA-binding protein [Clostridia bacterium]|nr:DNA-binding protein [Clostridia bacterium]
MFEKDLNITFLLDFYGDILSEKRRQVLDEYYNNDLSLSEIAQDLGVTRQGVRDLIKKAEAELLFYEEKLGLAKRFREAGEHAAALREMSSSYVLPDEVVQRIHALEDCVR